MDEILSQKERKREYDKVYRADPKNKERRRINKKAYREKNKEKLTEYYRVYRDEHREIVNAASRKWYSENQKLHLERTTRWRNEHKEEVAEARKKRYAANTERFREKRRVAYWKNPERARELARKSNNKFLEEHPVEYAARKKKWYSSNLDRNRNYAHKRRAKVRNVIGGHFTDAEFQEVCEKYGNQCLMCGRNDIPLTADHVIPLGPPYTDQIDNIQPLCLSCNSKKGTKTTDYRNSDVGVTQTYNAGLREIGRGKEI